MRHETDIFVVMILSYLLGSIPFGVIYAKMFRLGDLRKIGSGNIGATNVLRTGRKGVAALTLASDMFKGTVAVLVSVRIFGPDSLMIASVMSVIGHIFPVWLRLKGGKGVATYLGVLLAVSPTSAFCFAALWLITAAVSRYSSLSALVASAASPLIVAYMTDVRFGVVFLILTGFLFWKHSANIKRLMSGTETRIGSYNGKKHSTK